MTVTYPMVLSGGPGDGLTFGHLPPDTLAPPEVGFADYTPHGGFQMWTYHYDGVDVRGVLSVLAGEAPDFFIRYRFTGRTVPPDPRLTLEA